MKLDDKLESDCTEPIFSSCGIPGSRYLKHLVWAFQGLYLLDRLTVFK